MAAPAGFSKDFPIDTDIFTTAKISLSGATDANATDAILANTRFPAGDIEIGHVAFTADTEKVSVKPSMLPAGASLSFECSVSTASGAGVYGTFASAIKALAFTQPLGLKVGDTASQRYLLIDFSYSAAGSTSASQPIGLLGSVSFGIDAQHESSFAVIHRFEEDDGAHDVVTRAVGSWRLPRHISYDQGDINIKPGTWLLAEASGSLALKIAGKLGWDISFAKDAKLLGVTHNLSAKIDAGLTASFGFNVSGNYVIVAGREDSSSNIRLRVFKQASKGLTFGLNLSAGLEGDDPELPATFDDLIKSVFGIHGVQVLNDLEQWTAASTSLSQKLAGLTDQTVLDLLKSATGVDAAGEFDKAKQIAASALNAWVNLPEKVSSMLWNYLGRQTSAADAADFKTFLIGLANRESAAATLAKTLQKAAFRDTTQGEFLESISVQGLPALSNNLVLVSKAAGAVLDILDGGVIAKLQAFVNQQLDLTPIRKAVSDADFNNIEQWLKNRLGNFLDKVAAVEDLKDIQRAIQTLDTKAAGYYKTAVQALSRHNSISFAATYQKNTADTALIDVIFDLSVPEAKALYDEVVGRSNLDHLFTGQPAGVMFNQATLTHEIKRVGMVELNMPRFDFSETSLNDAIATLIMEDQGGRLLLYQVDAKDSVTVANRAASQLSILASLKVVPGQVEQLDGAGSLGYELREIRADVRALDLEIQTTTFIREYLRDLFADGDESIRTFYTDLAAALMAARENQSHHLGDIAVSMQVSLPVSALAGWFRARTAQELTVDQMNLSRALQGAWKRLLPNLYFQDSSKYQTSSAVAALLVWSSLPVSTSVDFDGPTIRRFNSDRKEFWEWADADLRHAIACDPRTSANLSVRLASIQKQLHITGSGNADYFDPSKAGAFVNDALDATGDEYLQGLLFAEAQLAGGAADALRQISVSLTSVISAPTRAVKTLATFAADLTNTFNRRVSSAYTGMSDRSVGPMLLYESSAALGPVGAKPAAVLTLYALNSGHQFDLNRFAGGAMPPRTEIALTQTLVSIR